jgi:dTDP-4-amino-4,6-dideoxygalactose transaminase
VRFWASQSREQKLHYEHKEIGYNYRMSNVLAGIGRGQLKVLDERITKKRYIHDYYKNALKDIEEINFMPENNWNKPNYWLTCITLKESFEPKMIINALNANNIESSPIWKPMHLQSIFQKYDYIGENVAQQIFETGVCLPSDTKMTDEDLNRVIGVIKRIFINE